MENNLVLGFLIKKRYTLILQEESNCGKQHQLIEESSKINAEDLQFPTIP